MKKIVIAIMIAIFAINLAGCNSNELTDKSVRKILKQDGKISETMNISSITIKAMYDLDNTEYNKFVLLYGKINTTNVNMYLPLFINTQEKRISEPFWETPLSMIMKQVLLSEEEDTNIAIFERAAEYTKLHGIDYFSSEENAIEFINDITLNNSIIDVKIARNIIFEQFVASLSTSNENVEVFFDKGTAIPKYIASKKLERVKNPKWAGLAGYSSTLSRDVVVTMENMFGPEYVMETVWETAKIGKQFELMGNFDSIEEIVERFNVDSTDIVSSTTAASPASQTENNSTSQTEGNTKFSQPVTNPSYEMYNDTEYGFQCSYPTHFSKYNDTDTATRYAVQSDDGRVKERICVKPQNGTTVEAELNSFISSFSGETTYKTSGSDYYAASIDEGTVEHYRFCKFKNGNMYWFEFHSPSNEHEIYDNYINDIYAAFHITK